MQNSIDTDCVTITSCSFGRGCTHKVLSTTVTLFWLLHLSLTRTTTDCTAFETHTMELCYTLHMIQRWKVNTKLVSSHHVAWWQLLRTGYEVTQSWGPTDLTFLLVTYRKRTRSTACTELCTEYCCLLHSGHTHILYSFPKYITMNDGLQRYPVIRYFPYKMFPNT